MFFATSTAKVLSTPHYDDFAVEDVNNSAESQSTLANPAPPGSLLKIKHCPNAPFFAAISYDAVYLWSARPDVMLSTVERSPATLLEDGGNIDLIWKPDASVLVVVTDKGYLHFYDIVTIGSKLYDLQFSVTHHYATGPGEGRGIPSRVLKFRMALEFDTGVQCGIGLATEILLCTRQFPSLLSLSWTGEVNVAEITNLADLPFYDDKSSGVERITMNSNADLFAWTSTSGRGYLTQRQRHASPTDDSQDAPSIWIGLCFHNPDNQEGKATSIAINSTFHLIALGTDRGDVSVFSLTEDRAELRFSHKCVVEDSGGGSRVGPVTSLAWSADGYALAVGWATGGMSVWSVFGRVLMSTVCEDADSGESGSESLCEPYFSGVQELFWGLGSYQLFVLPFQTPSTGPMTDIYVLPFARSSMACSNIMDNNRCIMLVDDDRIMLYEGNYWDFDVMNVELSQWDVVQVPLTYITLNWPIKYATVNPTGHYVAIAGKRGFAHYSSVSNRWRLFGNEQEEQSFSVSGGILWHRNLMIIACYIVEAKHHELRFFSREANLGDSNILCTERLHRPVVAMNNLDSHLLICTADNVMRYYVIVSESRGVSLTLQQQISLEGVIRNPSLVQTVSWVPPVGPMTPETIKSTPIAVLICGELNVLRESDGAWEMITLSDRIEYFWASRQPDRIGSLLTSLWAYDGLGFKIWPNMNANDDIYSAPDALVESLRIDTDFYPLTVLMHRGIVAGVDQRITARNALNCALYRISLKTHLFLPSFICYLLGRGEEDEAVLFAQHFSSFPYFSHSLEVLLHQILEKEAETYAGFAPEAMLPRVIHFLQQFPNWLDVIVQCARKTEVTMWEYFFSVVGDPKELFARALEAGSLNTATSYLIIIQTLEPAAISGKLAVRLLERAFELEDFETGKELVRFLISIEGPEGEIYRSIIKANTALPFIDDMPNDGLGPSSTRTPSPARRGNDSFYLNLLISKHLRELLRSYRLKPFARFARGFAFPLVPWLKHERNRAAMVDDWSLAFASLHDQYDWQWPTDMNAPSRKKVSARQRSISPQRRQTYPNAEPSHARVMGLQPSLDTLQSQSRDDADPALSTSSQQLRRRVTLAQAAIRAPDTPNVDNPLQELRSLMEVMLEAQCRDWVILIASMLMDVSTLQRQFAGANAPNLLPQWRVLMLGSDCRGYKQLLDAVEQTLTSDSELPVAAQDNVEEQVS
ncbi:RIC1-domain-containing protein [Gaertneriomyces semiglobifer]|nr:RIC1-domain-containing protein [Gaertneriomyces semiglobifer]